ncbi:MAG TPA: DUF2207 domain-containing protein, partial [Candidatus Dormibacteraeota bacterium]|nr:DUF2207 domain-containing protein [Candidatus Dormibacteraeota bacterium]
MKARLSMTGLAALWILAVAAFAAAPAHADEGWTINSFHSQITINDDASITVVEDIQVDFGNLVKHGIFRYIPVRYRYDSTRDRYYDLTVSSVTDGRSAIPYTVTSTGTDEVIKIGDPNRTVSGGNTYVITYRVRGVLNSFADHDELYWNVDGAQWPVPKKFVSATVQFPTGSFQGAACYQGPTGSREACSYGNTAQSVNFSSTRLLGSGEQLTAVTGLHKGALVVPPPLLEPRARQFPQDAFDLNPGTVGVSVLVLLAGLALIVRFWWVHGRDREYLTHYYLTNDPRDRPAPLFEHEPVVVEFGPPQNLRPAELGLILDESADTKDVTATIVDLAVRGVLTITEVPGKKDWTLTWKPNQVGELLPFEKTLLDGLFTGRETVQLSALKGTYRTTLTEAENEMYADAMSRKLFTTRPDYLRGGRIVLGVVLVIAGGFLTNWLGTSFGWGLIGVAVILVGIALVATFKLMSVRTAAGRDLMQHTLGFRLYMNTAEKYRQQFAEKAEIFTQLLPYAIVFGCVNRWAKAFEGIDTSQTNGWYVGGRPFQAALLASSLESMNSSISTAVASTPAGSGSSGFGGGGFSGGGGGGGG